MNPHHTVHDSAVALAEKLKARRKAKEKPAMPVMTMRTKLDPQEEAYIEAMLRDGAGDDELTAWRKSAGIHGMTFKRAVHRLRERIAASAAPSPMAAQFAALSVAAEPAPAPAEPPPSKALSLQDNPDPAEGPAGAIIIQPAAPAAGLDQLVNWLADLRAMRDQLAAHGVHIEGSVAISIDL